MKLLEHQALIAPHYLDTAAHDYTWERLRREIIGGLAKATGLPFAVAITRIVRWGETSEPWLEGWYLTPEKEPYHILRIRAVVDDEQ